MKRLSAAVLCALLVASAAVGYATLVRARADLDAQRLALQRTEDSLRTAVAKVDTQYAGERVVYAGWRERWDTARIAHLERVLDSLRRAGVAKPETVTVEVPVSVLVTADSTIRACNALVLTCEQREQLRVAQIVNLQQQLEAAPKPPSLAEQVVTHAIAAWLGSRLR